MGNATIIKPLNTVRNAVLMYFTVSILWMEKRFLTLDLFQPSKDIIPTKFLQLANSFLDQFMNHPLWYKYAAVCPGLLTNLVVICHLQRKTFLYLY